MKYNPKCPPFLCGKHGWVGFPFTDSTNPECRLHILLNCTEETPKIQLKKNEKIKMYDVESIKPHHDYVEDMPPDPTRTIAIKDEDLSNNLNHNSCDSFHTLTLPSLLFPSYDSYISFQITNLNKTLFKCIRNHTGNNTFFRDFLNYTKCSDYDIYYYRYVDPDDELPPPPPPPTHCSIIQLPLSHRPKHEGIFKLLTAELLFDVRVDPYCFDCYWRGSHCVTNSTGNNCAYPPAEKKGIDLGKMRKYIYTRRYSVPCTGLLEF